MLKWPIWARLGAMAAGLLWAGPGCGGANHSTALIENAPAVDPASSGTLTVHLVPDGLPGALSHLYLVLAGLEVRVAGQWRPVPLAVPGLTLDLLPASSQSPLLLASKVPWPAGANDAMRFSLGPKSQVQLAAEDQDTFHSLEVPTQFVSSMGPPGSFYVAAQTDTDLWIAFSVANVALPDPANSDQYLFYPGPVRGYDKAATGAISGSLTTVAAAGPPSVPAEPLEGAAVTAQLQQVQGPGTAIAFRTVVSDAQGHYTLDLLPKGSTWCVVGQPESGNVAYYPQVSPGFPLGGAPFDQYEASLAFAPAAFPGQVSGTVSAGVAVGEEDVVDLVQAIPSAGVPYAFVLRSAPVDQVTDGEFSFSFRDVPPGIYYAVLNDYSQSAGLGLVNQTRASAGFVVAAGSQITLQF